MPDTGKPFSIRDWIGQDDGGGFLFLTSRGDQYASLRGLISTWLEIAVNAMLSLAQDDGRRIWVILDELPTLHQVPSLQPGLAESRQFGGCFVLGVQVFSALRDLYGRNGAETISGLCGSRFAKAVLTRCLRSNQISHPHTRRAAWNREVVSLSLNITQKPATLATRRSPRMWTPMTAHSDAITWIDAAPPALGDEDCNNETSTTSAGQDSRSTDGKIVENRNRCQPFPKWRLRILEYADLRTCTPNLERSFGHDGISASHLSTIVSNHRRPNVQDRIPAAPPPIVEHELNHACFSPCTSHLRHSLFLTPELNHTISDFNAVPTIDTM